MATFSTWEQATVKPLPWSPIRCRGARGFPLEEPNREYLANYSAFLKTKAHLRSGLTLAAGFDEIDEAAADSGEKLPLDGSIDLGLAMHMLYFVEDLSASVTRMVRFLKPGGVLFVVVTDETVGYTGLALKSFVERGGETGDNARHLSVIAERRRLLGLPAEVGGVPRCSLPREHQLKSTWCANRADSTDTISPT